MIRDREILDQWSRKNEAQTVQEMVWSLFNLKGEPVVTRYSAAEMAVNHSYSIARARGLGYNPKIDREEGLRRFYEWVEKQGILDEDQSKIFRTGDNTG